MPRLFFVLVALVLRNAWVWLHFTYFAERLHGELQLHLECLRFRRMLNCAAGIPRVFQFDAASEWSAGAADALGSREPSFVWLQVEQQPGSLPPPPSRPMSEQIARLRTALLLPASS